MSEGVQTGAMNEEPTEETPSGHPVRSVFLFTAMMALVGFILAQVAMDERATGGAQRMNELMATTRAEIVELPLTGVQASWALTDASGKPFTLGSLPPDTLVFLNFWATWCPPCREELPSMLGLSEAMRDRRFMMVAVSYDETWDEIRDFFTRWIGRTPPTGQLLIVKDEKLEPGTTLRETFGTDQMPDTYVVMNGQVLARFVNARNWTDPKIIEYFQALAPSR